MRLTTAHETWRRWQAAAGWWRGWSLCPTLLAQQVEEIAPGKHSIRVESTAETMAARLAETLATGGGVCLLLDLEPTLGVSIAARLNEQRLANVVLLLPRWPDPRAILPVAELLQALATHARRLGSENLPHVALVVDAERMRPVPHRSPRDPRVDNRYRLSPHDLPNLAALRERSIDQVVKIAGA